MQNGDNNDEGTKTAIYATNYTGKFHGDGRDSLRDDAELSWGV